MCMGGQNVKNLLRSQTKRKRTEGQKRFKNDMYGRRNFGLRLKLLESFGHVKLFTNIVNL